MKIYPSDLSDKEWSIVEPILKEYYSPYKTERPKGGRKMWQDMRDILNGIFYVVKTGCQWKFIPQDFPPKGTVYYHFQKLKSEDVLDKILEATNRLAREKAGRKPDPTFGLIDSQSVKTMYRGTDRGIDGNKKVKGRKRHIVADILGCLLTVVVHAANIHDTVGAERVLEKAIETYPTLQGFCGDEGYNGTAVEASKKLGRPIEISKKIIGDAGDKKWRVIPKRWIVERTLAWAQNSRRLSKDYEVNISNSEAVMKVSEIRLNLKNVSTCKV
jgi:putative transposase